MLVSSTGYDTRPCVAATTTSTTAPPAVSPTTAAAAAPSAATTTTTAPPVTTTTAAQGQADVRGVSVTAPGLLPFTGPRGPNPAVTAVGALMLLGAGAGLMLVARRQPAEA